VSIILVTQPDGGQAGAFMVELGLVFAQLRDVLAAEDSPIVPQKDHHPPAHRPREIPA
jgi:hypothetical protein